MIEQIGIYRVKTAEGYVVFLHKHDIMLNEIRMPEKNGFEMVMAMRNHDPGIKTIYISGNMSRFRTRLEEKNTKYKASFFDKSFYCFKLTELFHEYRKERR